MSAREHFAPGARARLREAIAAAGGNEVFAIGRLDADGRVVELTTHAAGHHSAVPAFVERGEPGEVLIHNHPSGQLEPSEADLAVAGLAGAAGMGFWIVDNAVERLYAVVRPWVGRSWEEVSGSVVTEVLGADGRLATVIPGFEERPGQVRMAERVLATLNHGGVTLVEAGTGIGKSFAYLVPALAFAECNRTVVVVATASIALQDQLLHKDIPALARALERPIRAVVLKGRGNYVSRRRAELYLEGAGDTPEAEALRRWLAATGDGDRASWGEGWEPELWEEVASEADNCRRAKCPHFGRCFYFESRRRAAAAHIVVVNHALLAADLRIRREAGLGFGVAALLPPYRHLVIDEAHAFEGYVRGQLGAQLGELAVARWVRALYRGEGRPALWRRFVQAWIHEAPMELRALTGPPPWEEIAAALEALREEAATWFAELALWLERHGGEARRIPDPERAGFAELAEQGEALAATLEGVAGSLDRYAGPVAEVAPGSRRLVDLAEEIVARSGRMRVGARLLRAVLTNRSESEVAWAERRGRRGRPVVAVAPVDVGPLLAEGLWSELRSVVLTSATLSAGDRDFAFLRRGLGLESAPVTTVVEPSPFPYAERALLVLVRGLGAPPPGAPPTPWLETVAALTAPTPGGVLVLCTSYAAVRALGAHLRQHLPERAVLVQGEAAPGRLTETMRRRLGSVLVGTATFWEGIDLAGEALRHVIVTRLPFAVHDHPLAAAREAWVRRRGGDPFRELSLPEAVMRFRQGFGRLLRRREDWGVVSVLDERIVVRGYGRRFLAALPTTGRCEGPVHEVVPRLARWFAERSANSS